MKHQINLQPDCDVLDGRQLPALIRAWLEYCRTKRPKLTVDGYEFKVAYFVQWWADVGNWLNWELSEDTLLQFSAWLDTTKTNHGNPLSYNSKNDILRRLRQCLRWAYRRGYTNGRDFSAWVPQPAGGPTLRVAVVMDDLQRLLDAAGKSPFAERDQAILALFIQTGIRRAECASILIENIRMTDDLSGAMRVVGKRTKAKPTGERMVAFDALAGQFVAVHLRQCGATSGPLFCAVGGVPLSPQGIYKAVKRSIEVAGLSETIVGPHDLRRAFITDWRRRLRGAGYDHLLRMQVGHVKDSVTDLYDLADMEDLKGIISGPLSLLWTLPSKGSVL